MPHVSCRSIRGEVVYLFTFIVLDVILLQDLEPLLKVLTWCNAPVEGTKHQKIGI